jgi:hypothetical protein
MRRMLSCEAQKLLRHWSPSPRCRNVIGIIDAMFEMSTLEIFSEQLRGQCSSDNLSQQGRCCVSDLAYLVSMVAFDHPIIWEGLQPQ